MMFSDGHSRLGIVVRRLSRRGYERHVKGSDDRTVDGVGRRLASSRRLGGTRSNPFICRRSVVVQAAARTTIPHLGPIDNVNGRRNRASNSGHGRSIDADAARTETFVYSGARDGLLPCLPTKRRRQRRRAEADEPEEPMSPPHHPQSSYLDDNRFRKQTSSINILRKQGSIILSVTGQ